MAKSVDFILRFNPYNGYLYMKILVEQFGWKFMTVMTSTYFIVKGIQDYYNLLSEFLYYMESGLDIVQSGINITIAYTPWTIKGAAAMISDIFPLFGYQKKYFLYIFSICGLAGALCLSFLDVKEVGKTPWLGAMFFLLLNVHSAFSDILIEGKYAEQMKLFPSTGANLVTYSWFAVLFGSILPSFTVGVIVDHADIRYIYMIIIPTSFHYIFVIYFCGIPNDKVPAHKANKIDFQKVSLQWKSLFVTAVMCITVSGIVLFGMFTSPLVQFIYALSVGILVMILAYIFLLKVIAKALMYIFFSELLYINISTALNYFYLATDLCFPGGPQFSTTFYSTTASSIGSFTSILGLILFQVIFKHWKFHHMMWVTATIKILASLFDLSMVLRWNVAIGIPDEVFYIFGSAMVARMVSMIDSMGGILLMAKLCPKTIEATMFSLIAGSSNYGITASRLFGTFLIDFFGIKGTEPCQWDNFVLLIIISHFIAPLITIPLAFVLMPHKRATDNIVDYDDQPKHEIKSPDNFIAV